MRFRTSSATSSPGPDDPSRQPAANELRRSGLKAEQQQSVTVLYDGVVVGEFFADILVEGTILGERKATLDHHNVFTAPCLNYLKATGQPLCLLLNFGKPRLEIKRYRK